MSSATQAEWYQKNKDLTKVRAVKWAKDHPEERKGIADRSRRKHQEERNAAQRRYYTSTPEITIRRKQWTAEWKKSHLDNLRATENKRRSMKTQAGGYFTPEEWFTLCFAVGFMCLCCRDTKPLEADHVLPVSKGGSSFLYNIQPLCKSCNSRKNNKTIDYRENLGE